MMQTEFCSSPSLGQLDAEIQRIYDDFNVPFSECVTFDTELLEIVDAVEQMDFAKINNAAVNEIFPDRTNLTSPCVSRLEMQTPKRPCKTDLKRHLNFNRIDGPIGCGDDKMQQAPKSDVTLKPKTTVVTAIVHNQPVNKVPNECVKQALKASTTGLHCLLLVIIPAAGLLGYRVWTQESPLIGHRNYY
ncbi:uncharacterized protein LOC128653592 isoform X2 [Bombina bombina]|uniref:uncharacterized protein LOC128653592 isoform X2 n=1 Tax=Bombina bombina TaxID=8345 RepID=UPI00235A992B|nr:uncharacterized protein LOC128653592 isoform X2 [Bombina bombina]